MVAVSNINQQNQIDSLKNIDTLDYNIENMTLNIPVPEKGEITVVGTTALSVIDYEGNVYQPLQNKDVKVTLKLKKETKEFTIAVSGQYQDEGINKKPHVIPELAEWYGLEGMTQVDNQTTILVRDNRFNEVADMFIDDCKDIDINLKKDNVAECAIVFEYVNNSGYHKEGYGIAIEDNKVIIRAEHHVGAFYATRSLHQMLKNSQTNQLNNGYTRDYPKYAIRGLMLDVGRKFTDMNYIYEIMKTLSYYKMNDFQIHLNDNPIHLGHYDDAQAVLDESVTGFRLESDLEGNGYTLTSLEGYYTKQEFKQLIADSEKYGITIVPEFDMPGHALSFVKMRPDLMYQGSILDDKPDQERAAMLNLDNEETIPLIKTMYNEYLEGSNPVIGDVPVHIGSDEYYGEAEVFRKFVDEMLKFIRDDKKRTARVWGSLSTKKGETPVTAENVQMDLWDTEWAEPQEMMDLGYDLINIEGDQVYIVPGADYYQDYIDTKKLYDTYQPNKFNNGVLIDESHPQLLGGAFALWNDQIGHLENGITNYDMFDRIFDALPIIAQRNWGTDSTLSYDEFSSLFKNIAYAPNTNPRFDVPTKSATVLKYDFSKGITDLSGNGYDITKNNNVESKDGLHFNGNDSYIETPLKWIGPDSELEIELELKQTDHKQVLMETDDFGVIYAVNDEGYIGYDYEINSYSFNYKLKANQKTKLKFITRLNSTKLYVDGEEIPMIDKKENEYTTFVLPLQRIGGREDTLDGIITELNCIKK